MSADLFVETPITLSAVASTIPGARKNASVSPATVWRWCVKGSRAPDGRVVKLEHYRIGSRVMTTAEAVRRYVAALTDTPDHTSTPATGSPAKQQRAADRAGAELARRNA